jgi:hypothetical protein
MVVGIGSAIVLFTLFLVGHLLLFHRRSRPDRFKVIARIFLTALLGHGATILILAGTGIALASGLLVMLCLFVLYMPFFFTVATSLSIQTLILVERAPGGRAPIGNLREAFTSRQLVAGRLQSMVANGYLIRQGDSYQVSAKGRFVASIFRVLKRAWRLGAGG